MATLTIDYKAPRGARKEISKNNTFKLKRAINRLAQLTIILNSKETSLLFNKKSLKKYISTQNNINLHLTYI